MINHPFTSPAEKTRCGRLLFAFVGLFTFSVVALAQGTFQLGIGTQSYERGVALRQAADGGFIIGGYTESYGLTEPDMLLVKTDASGKVQWTQSYGGAEREVINDVVQTPDLGIMAIAEKYQANKKQGEFLSVLKTDASGNLLWKKIYDEGGNETEGFSMAATQDGNYIITGIVKKLNAASDALFTMKGEGQGVFLLKIDGSGNKLWSRRLKTPTGATSTGVSVIVAKDGSYMVTGNITKGQTDDSKMDKSAENVNAGELRTLLLAKVRPDGSLQWAKEYKANRLTAGVSLIEKKEGGFVITGICTPDNSDNMDFLVMSLSADGTVQWSKNFGGSGYDSVTDVVQTPDGGFVVSGLSRSFNEISDLLIFKTDNSGNLRWAKTYGGNNVEYGGRMVLTDDGIALTGESAIGQESSDVLLFKTDWSGNSGCWGRDVQLAANNFQLSSGFAEKSATVGVEPGGFPPDFKKADVNNIIGQSREVRSINICE